MIRSEVHIRVGQTSEWVASKIDEVLDPWHDYWAQPCSESTCDGADADGSPYLELVFRHTRLWALSYALQATLSRSGLTEALRAECLAAALSSCEYVCQQLRSSRSLWVSCSSTQLTSGLPKYHGSNVIFRSTTSHQGKLFDQRS